MYCYACSYDIGFEAIFTPDGGSAAAAVPNVKTWSRISLPVWPRVLEGLYSAPAPGRLTLKWDNS